MIRKATVCILLTLVAAGQSGQTGLFGPQMFLVPGFNPRLLAIPPGQAAVRLVNLSPMDQFITVFGSGDNGQATAVNITQIVGAGVFATIPLILGSPTRTTINLCPMRYQRLRSPGARRVSCFRP